MKIVINRCYGGFGLSDECSEALGGVRQETGWGHYYEFPANKYKTDLRTDPRLIELMEQKGSKWCSGDFAKLKIVEIPDDIDYYISDYDGMEAVEETHRTWD